MFLTFCLFFYCKPNQENDNCQPNREKITITWKVAAEQNKITGEFGKVPAEPEKIAEHQKLAVELRKVAAKPG